MAGNRAGLQPNRGIACLWSVRLLGSVLLRSMRDERADLIANNALVSHAATLPRKEQDSAEKCVDQTITFNIRAASLRKTWAAAFAESALTVGRILEHSRRKYAYHSGNADTIRRTHRAVSSIRMFKRRKGSERKPKQQVLRVQTFLAPALIYSAFAMLPFICMGTWIVVC